ncbi:MAG TPA: homocysteine S-methyltransferase family protein, partial [Actinomycetota bacterium]
MDAEKFRSLVAAGPVLADGAMGTALIARGAPVDACLDEWSLREPAAVEAVHRASIEAGARIVWTNTFGANRFRLERHGLQGRVAAICAAGVGVARRAGAELVAGSLGPLGVRLAPYGRVRPADAADAYREQAEALASAGVDVLVLETQSDLREMEQAIGAIRDASPGLALLVTATFTRDDRTLLGSTPEQVADALLPLRVDGIGVNCGEGPAQVLRVARRMRAVAGDAPIVARPNAGGPAEVAGRLVYPATPAYVGEVARALLGQRVAVLGGCCGTGPEHVAAIGEAIREAATAPGDAGADATARRDAVRVEVAPGVADDDERLPTDAIAPTGLEASLAAPGPTIAVEMEPPRSFNAAALVAAAATLRDAGADAIDVADSPMAKMRMSAWAACRLV